MATSSRYFALVLTALGCTFSALGVEQSSFPEPKFTGSQSCQSSACHGGGVGKDQSVIWEKKDVHSRSHAILATTRSSRIGDALGIKEPPKSARCTVCHSPFKALSVDHFAKDAKPDNGVSCESCHGAAEPWVRFHTRLDITHEQRVAAGLRELTNLYSRANSCVACHLNIDDELVVKGRHPEMFFELDGQMAAQPPHYKDPGSWVGPKAWLTGQAVVLREFSWKLSKHKDESLNYRWKALTWLLQRSGQATSGISENDGYTSVQSAADQLARNAATTSWSKEKTSKLLKSYTALSSEFRDPKLEAAEARRRGEVLVLAIDRLWVALKKEGGMKSSTLDDALRVLADLAREQAKFDKAKFASALEQLQVTLELIPAA